ncbi:MAG: hypothetical protein GWO23_03590, partial [Gammaproteobacteria bacterium]|nr:hypothetical protein [Gammaproteobacteria bacterium]
CSGTTIRLERGGTYRFDVSDSELRDGDDPRCKTNPDGNPAGTMFAFIPMQRHIGQPWLKVYGKIS